MLPEFLGRLGQRPEMFEAWLDRLGFSKSKPRVAPAPIAPRRKGRTDEELAKIAKVYVDACDRGERSPVKSYSPICYLDVQLPTGIYFDTPSGHDEIALYPVTGTIELDGESYGPQQLLILAGNESRRVRAQSGTRMMVLGGDRLKNERHIWWNLVSSRPERIEKAKSDWKAGRFDPVPGDDEFIPLPES